MYNYLGTNRGITVNFKSAAMTRHELAPMYRKLNYLASTLAPSYSKDGFMRGTITNFTLGSYFYNLPGFISSLTYSWNPTYPFEIALNSPNPITGERQNDTDVQELPMVLDVAMTFTPIHRFTPQTGYYHYTTNNISNPFFEEGVFKEENEKLTLSPPPEFPSDLSKKIGDTNTNVSDSSLFMQKYKPKFQSKF